MSHFLTGSLVKKKKKKEIKSCLREISPKNDISVIVYSLNDCLFICEMQKDILKDVQVQNELIFIVFHKEIKSCLREISSKNDISVIIFSLNGFLFISQMQKTILKDVWLQNKSTFIKHRRFSEHLFFCASSEDSQS